MLGVVRKVPYTTKPRRADKIVPVWQYKD